MNKTQVIKKMAKKLKMPVKKTTDIVNLLTDTLTEALVNGEKITIRDFASFEPYLSKETTRRNPKTGDVVDVEAKTRIKFKSSENLMNKIQEADIEQY